MANKHNQDDMTAIAARVLERLGIASEPRTRPNRKGVQVMVTMQADELKKIDSAAKEAGETRSHYMRQAALQRAKSTK